MDAKTFVGRQNTLQAYYDSMMFRNALNILKHLQASGIQIESFQQK